MKSKIAATNIMSSVLSSEMSVIIIIVFVSNDILIMFYKQFSSNISGDSLGLPSLGGSE